MSANSNSHYVKRAFFDAKCIRNIVCHLNHWHYTGSFLRLISVNHGVMMEGGNLKEITERIAPLSSKRAIMDVSIEESGN